MTSTIDDATASAANAFSFFMILSPSLSPTEMFNVSGTKRILFPDGPTATSKTWLPANRLPLGT